LPKHAIAAILRIGGEGMSSKHIEIIRQPAKGVSAHPPVLFVHGAWHGAWIISRRPGSTLWRSTCGHGNSEAHGAMRWNRISGYADDVMHVLETLDEKPVLIGHSMGGLVAQHCMKRAGAKLAGAGLLATVPWHGVWRATSVVAMRHPLIFAEANLRWTLYPIVREPGRARELFLEADVPQAEAEAFAAKLCDESYVAYLDMLGLGLAGKFEAEMPVMVIGGEKDALFTPASQHSTAQRYNGACHIIAGAPHDIMLASQWRQAADLLVDWIKALG
jgi:pimeloyl-ACP methyl ester carboxylesterase